MNGLPESMGSKGYKYTIASGALLAVFESPDRVVGEDLEEVVTQILEEFRDKMKEEGVESLPVSFLFLVAEQRGDVVKQFFYYTPQLLSDIGMWEQAREMNEAIGLEEKTWGMPLSEEEKAEVISKLGGAEKVKPIIGNLIDELVLGDIHDAEVKAICRELVLIIMETKTSDEAVAAFMEKLKLTHEEAVRLAKSPVGKLSEVVGEIFGVKG